MNHGHASRNGQTATYRTYRAMWKRCCNPNYVDYPQYGGTGIRLCERWKVFANFLADMGPRPPGKTLDRKDPNGDYSPENCRWATVTEQNRNKRTTKLTPKAVRQIKRRLAAGIRGSDIAELFGVTRSTVSAIKCGKQWVGC